MGILTSNCGRPSAVNLIAVIPVPKVAPKQKEWTIISLTISIFHVDILQL